MASDQVHLPVTVKKQGFYYGNVVVAAAFFIMVMAAGTLYSFGVFFKPMADDFGWGRAATAGPYSVALFVIGLLSMFTGRLTDRFGSRLVTTVCGVVQGTGYILMSRVNSMWQLYLSFGLVMAIGQSGCIVPMMSTVARWFTRRRGLMTGIMMAGVGAGQAVVPPAMTRLIAIEGWRTSLLVLGLLSLTVIVVAAQFLRREPDQAEQPSSAGQNRLEQKALITDADGLSRHEALRTVPLWVLCAAYFCYDFVLQGTIVHIVPHATDLGISAMAAANILLSSA